MPPPQDWAPWRGPDPNQAGRPVGPGMQGRLTGQVYIDGRSFPYATGGWKTPSAPIGEYPITPGLEGGKIRGRPGGGVAVAGATGIWDPLLQRLRTGIALHATSSNDLDRMMTEGCFGIRKEQWPEFKQLLLDKMKREGSLNLRLDRTGRVDILSKLDKEIEEGRLPEEGTAIGKRLNVADVAIPGENEARLDAITPEDEDLHAAAVDEVQGDIDEEDALNELDDEHEDEADVDKVENEEMDQEKADELSGP
jgi:hypothetical protein